jgi:uncharacterized membrane protein YbhN (UPF0104 family)
MTPAEPRPGSDQRLTDPDPRSVAGGRLQSQVRGTSIRVGVRSLLVIGLGVELILAVPYVAHAARAISHPDLRWLLAAVGAELASMYAFGGVQRRMLTAGGVRVGPVRMTALVYAANAISITVPIGTVASSTYTFRRLRSWGASVPLIGFTLVASSMLSIAAFAVLSTAALATSPLRAIWTGGAVAVLLVLALAARRWFGTSLRLEGVATALLRRVNRLLRRDAESGLRRLAALVRDLAAIRPTRRDWLVGSFAAAVNWIADLACLECCLRAVPGTPPSIAVVALAYVAGQSVSSFSLLPGGLGVADTAVIVALIHGGAAAVHATTAVILYRLVSYAFIAALGWLLWAANWQHERRHRAVPTRRIIGAAALMAQPPSRVVSNSFMTLEHSVTGPRTARLSCRLHVAICGPGQAP